MLRTFTIILVLATGSAMAAEPRELVTAPNAVLCLSAHDVDTASFGRIRDQEWLRDLGCMRSPAGVPATLLSDSDAVGILNVRFRPEGISGGVTLWGRPSAFTLPDGTPLKSLRAEN